MDIDFIIPAKSSSSRVPNKNWKAFSGSDSLVDLTIKKLLAAGANPERVFVSCECPDTALPTIEKHGVQFLQRLPTLCANDVPLTTWIRAIAGQVPSDSDIAWCQVCDPLFDEYAECVAAWEGVKARGCDSLVVCYPWRGYLMTDGFQPIGWSFGTHHTPSQQLPVFHTMPFTFSLLTRKAIAATGYHVGSRPHWYCASGESVDIDTEVQFRVAQELFRQSFET